MSAPFSVAAVDQCARMAAVDGVHDLGGVQGFGPVDVEEDEPVFHADWERRAFRMTIASMMAGHLSGRFRHAIERMDPSWYLASPYYEHWLTATATGLVEAGLITQADLDDRLGAPYPVARPVRAPRLADPGPSSSDLGSRAAIACGCTNGIRSVTPGRRATCRASVVRWSCGSTACISLPDVEYHCDAQREEPTYSVRFEARELWGEPGDPVHVDLWESYLEPAEGATMSDDHHHPQPAHPRRGAGRRARGAARREGPARRGDDRCSRRVLRARGRADERRPGRGPSVGGS